MRARPGRSSAGLSGGAMGTKRVGPGPEAAAFASRKIVSKRNMKISDSIGHAPRFEATGLADVAEVAPEKKKRIVAGDYAQERNAESYREPSHSPMREKTACQQRHILRQWQAQSAQHQQRRQPDPRRQDHRRRQVGTTAGGQRIGDHFQKRHLPRMHLER